MEKRARQRVRRKERKMADQDGHENAKAVDEIERAVAEAAQQATRYGYSTLMMLGNLPIFSSVHHIQVGTIPK